MGRVFRKDQDVVNSINNLGFATANWVSELNIRIVNWDDLNALQKTNVTTILAASNYAFDYDE